MFAIDFPASSQVANSIVTIVRGMQANLWPCRIERDRFAVAGSGLRPVAGSHGRVSQRSHEPVPPRDGDGCAQFFRQ